MNAAPLGIVPRRARGEQVAPGCRCRAPNQACKHHLVGRAQEASTSSGILSIFTCEMPKADNLIAGSLQSVSDVLEATLPVLAPSVLDAPASATAMPLSGSRLDVESLPPPPLRQGNMSQHELVIG